RRIYRPLHAQPHHGGVARVLPFDRHSGSLCDQAGRPVRTSASEGGQHVRHDGAPHRRHYSHGALSGQLQQDAGCNHPPCPAPWRAYRRGPERAARSLCCGVRKMGGLYNVWDYREAAKRRMPRAFFEFLDRGTEDEHAMRANRAALEAVKLRQRILQDVRQIDTSTELFGRKLPLPLATAPTGVADIIAYRGELAVARAAGKAGIPYTLATSSTTPMEAVVEAATAGCWLQMYVWEDRAASYEIADRAASAGMEALVITVDAPVLANR